MASNGARFRGLLASQAPLVLPGAVDALTARIIEQAGFPALYVTGAGVANSQLAMPDLGILAFTELLEQAGRIASAVGVPVIADADTGYGGVASVQRTVREYERANLAGMHLEDQEMPKRCGHFEGKSVVPIEEMIARLQAALDARTDPDFFIIARTDARSVEGLDGALHRAKIYRSLGVDAIFLEAPQSNAELRRIGEELRGITLLANMVEGGKTPLLPAHELKALGFDIILYANTALRLASFAVREGMRVLRRDGHSEALAERMITWQERQSLAGLPQADAYERDLVARISARAR